MYLTRGFASGLRAVALALVAAAAVLGCGGGGDVSTPPTALPSAVTLAVPAAQQNLGTPVAFSSNVADPEGKLAYAWSFGDDIASALAAPSHAYAKPGDYTVTLTVKNEAGDSRTSTAVVRVADLAIVQGKACSGGGGLGWCWQRPLPQGNAINDTVFVDDLRGWAVGESGTILATGDGGVTWRAQSSGTSSSLYKVTFADAQVGWITGAYGQVLRTTDGGATWQSFSVGRADTIESVGATDANSAWVQTYAGPFVTTDGGAHWQPMPGPSASYGYQFLAVTSVTDAWAVRNDGYEPPSVVHSADGGRTWTSAGIPPAEDGFYRNGMRMQFTTPRLGVFLANESGYFGDSYVSGTVVWQTADGGASWQRLNLAATNVSIYGNAVQVVAPDAAFMMSEGSAMLQRTADLGATWQSIPLPKTTGYWTSYRAYSATRVTLADSNGRLLLTADGGATWADRSAGQASLPAIGSVWFFDTREGLALASDGSSIRTTDGGQNWTTTAPLSAGNGWQRAQFAASGKVGWVAAGSTIYRSTDRGLTWLAPAPQTSASIPNGVADFHFVDEMNGWAVGRYSSALIRTTDGGMGWQAVANSPIVQTATAVRFADPSNGIIPGEPGVAWVTADGGVSWRARPTGIRTTLLRMAFTDATTVVAVGSGGAIVRSTDRGLNWRRAASPTANDLNDLQFVTPLVGFAAGAAGTLLKTTDGGLTWTAQETATNQALVSIFFVDEQTGWVGGSNGAVLATANGGR